VIFLPQYLAICLRQPQCGSAADLGKSLAWQARIASHARTRVRAQHHLRRYDPPLSPLRCRGLSANLGSLALEDRLVGPCNYHRRQSLTHYSAISLDLVPTGGGGGWANVWCASGRADHVWRWGTGGAEVMRKSKVLNRNSCLDIAAILLCKYRSQK
jgi:hypothetical protein